MQSSLGRNGEVSLIKHAVELPSLALQLTTVGHGIISFLSKSVLIFLLLPFPTLSPFRFLLCPLSFLSPAFRSAYIPPSLPLCLCPCLPSWFPLIKAGIQVTVLSLDSQTLPQHNVLRSLHGTHFPAKSCKTEPLLTWYRRTWPCTKEISVFLLFIIFVFWLLFWFGFSEISVLSAFYLSLGRWEAIYPLIIFVLAVHSVYSSMMVISTLRKSFSTGFWRSDLHRYQLGWYKPGGYSLRICLCVGLSLQKLKPETFTLKSLWLLG